MDKMTEEWYFSDSMRSQEAFAKPGFIAIPNETGYLHVPISELTARERFLLGIHDGELMELSKNAWAHYLMGDGKQPYAVNALQFCYIDHQLPLSSELVALLKELFLAVEAVVPISDSCTAFILNQEERIDVTSGLQAIIPTIESDFGVALSVFLGNTWSHKDSNQLRQLFQTEHELMMMYPQEQKQRRCLSFSRLVLWALANGYPLHNISVSLLASFDDQEEMRTIIPVLWEEQGNLVRAAKTLYSHRNSLQYKLDKWQKATGLQLRQLDDLALCYLLLLKN